MAKPRPIDNAEEFLAVVRKSRVLSPEQLEQTEKAHGEFSDPMDIAKFLVKRGWITRWQAGQLLGGWHVLKLGKYTLLDQLGKGETGRVFLAEHDQLKRRAVVKTLSRRHTDRPELVAQFFAEATEAAALDHRNLIHVYDVAREGDRHYFVVEYVEGRDLEAIVTEYGPLRCPLAADYAAQAAHGLAHAHRHSMVHRDLKPSNLLVDERDVVKVLDLGVGRLAESSARAAADPKSLSAARSPYLAPEQASREPASDHRSDIFSLGCTLWFLLTGAPPIKDTRAPQADVARLLIAQRPTVPIELASICAKMIAVRPEDRYQSAAEVAQALEAWLESQPGDDEEDDANKTVSIGREDTVSLRMPPPADPGGKAPPNAQATAPDRPQPTRDSPGKKPGKLKHTLLSPPALAVCVAAILAVIVVAIMVFVMGE